MKNIRKDIAENTFKRVYLLCGTENYLINQCRDMIKNAVLGSDGSEMNYSYYDGNKGFDIKDLNDSVTAFPFFADHRLVIVENSGLFGASGAEFADTVESMPDTTVLIIIEQNADKRTRLYKSIQKIGYICELKTPDSNETASILGSRFNESGKRISTSTLMYFIDYVGGDLFNLVNEADKLSDYTGERATITEDDVNAVCTMQIERKIYDIIDNLVLHNQKRAMQIYFDLIALKESPLGILRLLMSQYNTLLLVRDGMDAGKSDAQIASDGRLAPWQVQRNRAKLRNFDRRRILSALVQCINTEESIKTGNIAENAGIEILLANLSTL
ncbi:MAG: DNA polymerase III subunit delta [Lachnospiraceae bacterium]|nr:DNA polymerase III subunit delta [Lachnospiraceae bacterium]